MSRIRTIIAILAIILAGIIPVFFAVSALGAKFGMWDWRTGFDLVRGPGKTLLLAGVVLGAVSLVFSVVLNPRKTVILSLLALATPLIGIGYGKAVGVKAKALPAIHDITTDTADVPIFTQAIITRRGADANSLEYNAKVAPRSKKLLAEVQAKAYPEIKTIMLDLPADAAFTKALEQTEAMGWEIVTKDFASGIIEATATSFWFGFKDDVVIRIRPAARGSLIDVRSVSRVGVSDIGANAARIHRFSQAFRVD